MIVVNIKIVFWTEMFRELLSYRPYVYKWTSMMDVLMTDCTGHRVQRRAAVDQAGTVTSAATASPV